MRVDCEAGECGVVISEGHYHQAGADEAAPGLMTVTNDVIPPPPRDRREAPFRPHQAAIFV